MTVFAIISELYLNVIAAIAGAVFFGFLAREYRRRRSPYLMAFGLSLLFAAGSAAATFLGHLSFAYGTASAGAIARFQIFCIVIQTFLVMLGSVSCYGGKVKRPLYAAAAAVTLLAAYLLWPLTGAVTVIGAMRGVVLDIRPATALATYQIISGLILSAAAALAYFRTSGTRAAARSDRLLALAGSLGIALALAFLAGSLTESYGLLLFAGLVQIAYLAALFFGAAAKEHEDPRISGLPLNFLRRSFMAKTAFVNVIMFWALSFLIVIVASVFFTRAIGGMRQDRSDGDLRLLAAELSARRDSLIERAAAVSFLPQVTGLKGAPAGAQKALPDALAPRRGSELSIDVFDRGGRNLFSAPAANITTWFAVSPSVQAALQGERAAVLESDPGSGQWVLRAAAPVVFADGSGGVAVATAGLASLTSVFNDEPVSPTAFGLFAADGSPVLEAGRPLDAAAADAVRRAAGGDEEPERAGDDWSALSVSRVFSSPGRSDGAAYVAISREAGIAEAVRILSVVTLVIFLALVVLTFLVILLTSLVLRPVRELRAAARCIESGDCDSRVPVSGSDELSELAASFNRMGQTIRERTEKLRAAVREQQDFLMNTAHEMRTPLNVFRWTVDLMRFGDTGRLNKIQLELVEQLHQTNRRLLALVQNLLDTSSIEQRRVVLKRNPIQIEDVIDEAAGAMAVRIREKNLNFSWKRPAEPLPKAFGDRDRLYQVLLNLVSNAVKYTPSGGRVAVGVDETSEAGPAGGAGRFLRVTVEDNGRGIPKDQQSRVFERFFRARNVLVDDLEGTGLGLYIVKQLVDMHGGQIWFDSAEGSGSSFHFTVPTVKPAEPGAPKAGPRSAAEKI